MKQNYRKILFIFFPLFFVYFLFIPSAVLSQGLSEDMLISNEIDWVLGNNQLDSGVITMNGRHIGAWIVPYQTSYFAIHALKAKPSVAPQVKNYILWHFNHINTQPDPDGLTGTIFDYNVVGSGIVPSYIYTPGAKMYDSVDSYAAVFFSLLRTYWDITHDSQLLIDNDYKIKLIFGSLMAVMKPDNLTTGTATWLIQYTMDNFEVNIGLHDIAYIYRNAFNDIPRADYIERIANANKAAIERDLWNGKIYKVSKQHKFSDFNWKTLYPDALVALLGLNTGYLSPDSIRSKSLYDQFKLNQPNWTSAQGDFHFPLTLQAYTAALMKDYSSVQKYDKNLQNKYFPNREWPYHTGEAAFYIAYHNLLRSAFLPGDLNQDGKVDIFDYNLLVQNFGSTTCGNVADIDANCKVDIFDYNILVGNFGK